MVIESCGFQQNVPQKIIYMTDVKCLNTAIKYSLFLPLAWELFKNNITLDTMVYKIVSFLFFEQQKHWPILIIFGVQHYEETWRKRL